MPVSVSTAARILGISYKTVERAINCGDLDNKQVKSLLDDARTHKPGPKYYLVDLEEARDLFTKRGTITRLAPSEDAQVINDLLDEIAALKAQLVRRTQPVALTPRITTPRPKPTITAGYRGDLLPDGWASVNAFGAAHGVPKTTLERMKRDRRFAYHDGAWWLGNTTSHAALDVEQQKAFLALFHARGGLALCPDAECLCKAYAPSAVTLNVMGVREA